MQLQQKSGHKGLGRSYDQALLNFSMALAPTTEAEKLRRLRKGI
jgi:hypothetical protein